VNVLFVWPFGMKERFLLNVSCALPIFRLLACQIIASRAKAILKMISISCGEQGLLSHPRHSNIWSEKELLAFYHNLKSSNGSL
jgi:hypothetical protein